MATTPPVVRPHIFRQYDIRGIVGEDLTSDVAEAVGRAFATYVRRELGVDAPRIVVGRDNRPSSELLADALRNGLRAAGARVTDIGLVPTPVHSFATVRWSADGGVQVTGSHNPPQYNGFKLSLAGRSLFGPAVQEIRSLIERGDFEVGEGTVEQRDAIGLYIREVAQRFRVPKRIKVVVDCGNGVGSLVAVDLLRALGPEVEVVPLYCESDGTFPNHHPDPVVDANLRDLIATVQRTNADLGVAFDGDADRIGAVDDRGRIVRGDLLLLLFAQDVLRRHPGEPIVFDVKCSQVLVDGIAQAGGRPIMAPTGHSVIKERMRQEGALLAGELSGHLMFGENYYGFDDALYAACYLVSLVAQMNRPLSAWVDGLPRMVATPELRYPATEDSKWEIVQRAVEHFRRRYPVVDVDGVRILFPDGWGLVRASNTEPVLVGRFEATSEEALQRIRAEVEGWLREQGIPGPREHA